MSDTITQEKYPIQPELVTAIGQQETYSPNILTTTNESAVMQADPARLHVQVVWSISVVLIVLCLTVRFFRWVSELMCKSHDQVLDEYFADLETENQFKPVSLRSLQQQETNRKPYLSSLEQQQMQNFGRTYPGRSYGTPGYYQTLNSNNYESGNQMQSINLHSINNYPSGRY